MRGIKANFPNMFKVCVHCPLNCNTENPQRDTQEHVLECTALGGSKMDLQFMHAEHAEQSLLGEKFSKLMKKRAQLLEDTPASTPCCCLLRAISDRSTAPSGGAAAIQVIHV